MFRDWDRLSQVSHSFSRSARPFLISFWSYSDFEYTWINVTVGTSASWPDYSQSSIYMRERLFDSIGVKDRVQLFDQDWRQNNWPSDGGHEQNHPGCSISLGSRSISQECLKQQSKNKKCTYCIENHDVNSLLIQVQFVKFKRTRKLSDPDCCTVCPAD